jgi:hypothetical protein
MTARTYVVKGRRFSDAQKAIDAAESAARRSGRPVMVSELGYGGLHTVFPSGEVGPAHMMSRAASRLPNGGRKVTKTQKRANASKRSKAKRMANALRKYLKTVNPAMNLSGAAVVKLKGGAIKITPIKANRARGRR